MSFFGRSSNNNTPPGTYNRVAGNDNYRSQLRPNAPPSAQYHHPQHGYNDAPSALYDKRGEYSNRRSPAPPSYQQQRHAGQYVSFPAYQNPTV